MNRTVVAWSACAALLIALAATRGLLSPARPIVQETPEPSRPAPVVATIGGEKRLFRLDALLAYGATPFAKICPQGASASTGDDAARAIACGENASLSMAAAFRLVEASRLAGVERDQAIRDANGLALEALSRAAEPGTGAMDGMSLVYAQMGEKPRDLRLLDIAGEIAVVEAALCDKKAAPACASKALEHVGASLTEQGREANDFSRLVRAGELLRQSVDALPKNHDAKDRAELIEDLGSAYNYAAHFEPQGRKLKWLNLAIDAGEENMAYADAQAPSFTSARIWSNLGAVYAARGGDQTSSADFQRGIALYDRALGFFTKDEDPEGFAKTTQNRAAARSAIATKDKDLGLHGQAIADHEASIALFDEAKDAFDAAYGRYRLARALGGRARTAIAIRDGRTPKDPAPETLIRISIDSVAAALAALSAAEPVLRASGSADYLQLVEQERASLLRLRETFAAEAR